MINMATGGFCGQYKPENEYFYRYFRLVNETGAKPLKQLLENEATSRGMNVQAFLVSKRNTVQTLLQRNVIRQNQFDLIYPTQGPFNLHSLDISLLCCVIKNICSLTRNGRIAAEDLRKARNDICHSSIPEMQMSTYNTKFAMLQSVIKILLNECGDQTFEKSIVQEMDTIKNDPISIAQTLELIKSFHEHQKAVNFDKVEEKLEDLDSKLSKKTDVLTSEMQMLYARVDKQPKETRDVVVEVLKEHVEQHDSEAKIHPTLEPLKSQTEAILNEVTDFVHTEQFYEAEKILMSTGNVIIAGGTGEGKTYTAAEIMRRQGNGMNCLQISCPNDVYLIDPRIFKFIFIDDIFGNNELDESKLKSWIPVLEKLQQLVNAKELKLIIASREIVLKECIQSLNKFTMFTRKIVLSSAKLCTDEKLEILSKALEKRKKICSREVIQKCVSAFNSDIGFPYMSVLFSSDEQFFHEKEHFFERNHVINSGILSQLAPCKQMTLLFLWIKGKRFPVVLNRSEENDGILVKLSGIVKYKKDIDAMYDEIYTNLRVMDGVFVNFRSDGYRFAHNSVYLSTGFYVAQKGLYDEVILCSNLAFFMENIVITESIYRADCVFVRKHLYLNLVNRVISEVTENKHAKEMALHPCLSTDILKLLIETLKQRKQLKEFLLSGGEEEYYLNYESFIAHYIETCSANSCWFLKQVLTQTKCKKHFTQIQKERDCKSYRIQLHACYGACRGGNLAAFKMVQLVKFDGQVLVDIAETGNTDMYTYVKRLFRFGEVFSNEAKALTKTIEKGDIKMYNAIRRTGSPVTTECLYTAALAKNAELIKIITHDLSASRRLKVDKYVGYTLSTLFDMTVFDTFIQNGICPSPDNLLSSMKENCKLVETILWDAKYAHKLYLKSGKFDPMLKLWSKLVNDIVWKTRLVEMGILETFKVLENDVEMGNVEQVNEIIQHMTRKNDWRPESCLAINLLNASLQSNDLMIQLLLSCGVIPSELTLNKAVLTGQLNVVKMIVARMKTSGTFDPNRKGIKRAFLQAVFDFSIYEFLAAEGLKPNGYHFAFAIESQRENADTLKVVQNIFSFIDKESLSNTKVMDLGLLTALYNEEVTQCFMEHGVLLPEKALADISFVGNLEEVKRAMKYLRHQNTWPPSQDTMSRSLKYTFYRPAIFEVLMTEYKVVNYGLPIIPYSILFACRKKDYSLIDDFICSIDYEEDWNPEDIVLKLALLESRGDESTCKMLKRNGIRTDDLLDNAYELGSTELQSYIIAYLTQKDQNVINFKTLNKYIVSSLSNYPELCSEQLLDRALDVCDNDIVFKITKTLTYSNMNFQNSDAASAILCKISGRHELYSKLLKLGLTPAKECLLSVVKHGSLQNFQDTIEALNMMTILDSTYFSRKVLQESLKRSNVRFYTTLAAYGLKPQYEDIEFAIENKKYTLCKFLISDVEQIPESGNETVVLRILETDVNLYRQLYERGIRLNTFHLFLIINSYFSKKLPLDRIKLAVSDFFLKNSWSFEDADFNKICEISKTDKALREILFEQMRLTLKNKVLDSLFSRNSKELKELLNTDSYEITRCLPDILRQVCLLRKRIDPDCRKVISERIQLNDCSPSLKILSSVTNLGEESTMQIIYSLSKDAKEQLDKCVIQTALEEAIYLKKPGLYLFLLKECNVEPSTYCLLYCLYHQYDSNFDTTLEMLPKSRRTCKDPYYKATLALCCQRADIKRFRELLKFDKVCETEMLYEAVVSGNRIIIDQVKEILMTNGKWDIKDYWISSALLESRDDPDLENFEESDYAVPSDFLLDAEDEYLNPRLVVDRNSDFLLYADDEYLNPRLVVNRNSDFLLYAEDEYLNQRSVVNRHSMTERRNGNNEGIDSDYDVIENVIDDSEVDPYSFEWE